MTKLFEQIEQLIPKLHGWCEVPKAQRLASCVLAIRPQVNVLIGVWGGRDTFAMAMAHKENGFGTVIGIDPWTPTASVEGQGKADSDWWGTIDHELVYNDFIKTMKSLELEPYISVIRQKSDDVVPPPTIDMLGIDGNHGAQAIKDARRFASNVRVGGLCCLDDLDWGQGAVREAEKYILSIGFVQLYKLGTGAMYQRMGVL